MMRNLGACALAVLALGCSRVDKKGAAADPSPRPTPSPIVEAPSVTATISSATLADDCGAPVSAGGSSTTTAAGGARAMRCNGPNCGGMGRRRACQQTQVQLALVGSKAGPRAHVEVVSARLLDAQTRAPLQDLAARNPQLWAADGTFHVWDGQVEPRATLQVSADLEAPDWVKIGGGSRQAAQGKSFLLEVTLRVGERETRVERVVESAVVMPEPAVMT